MVLVDRSPRRRPPQPMTCPSIWTWFFGGILTGIGLSVLTYGLLLHPQPASNPAAPNASTAPPVEEHIAEAAPPAIEVREVPVVVNEPEADNRVSASSTENLSAAASTEEEEAKPAADEKKRPRFEFYDALPSTTATQTAPPVEAGEAVVTPELEALPQFPVALEPGQAPPPVGAEDGAKALQVASFQQYKDADLLKARLALLGLQARIQTALINGRQWYRVRLGPFYDAQTLEQARQRLMQANLDSLTVPF